MDVEERWDVVIVGGGSAGAVIANRLSDDADRRVLLLEAGGEPKGLAFRVPALIQKIPTAANWLYPVEPDPSRGGLEDPWSNGRVLGGGSSVNAMLWVRGHRADYDGWSEGGCEGWSANELAEYFRRSERYVPGGGPSRGRSGPVTVDLVRVDHPTIDAFAAAAEQAGYRRVDDYHDDGDVVALAQVNQRRGLRCSVVDAYLRPARRRPNLRVLTGAQVDRIRVEGDRATGVEYTLDGSKRFAAATREVVVCAGALGSPKLLLLSGIGPAEQLIDHGIAVIADLPGVGRNLQEHPSIPLVFEVSTRTLNQDASDPVQLAKHVADFVVRGRGAITSPAAHAVAFGRFDAQAAAPDFELIFTAFGLAEVQEGGEAAPARGLAARLRHATARTGGKETGRHQVAAEPLVTVRVVLLHPQGRGEVALRSANPTDPPLIRHDLLSEAADLRGLVAAARRAREVMACPALSDVVVSERLPGAVVVTDDDWEGYVRDHAGRLNHPSGTCAMGAGPDAVVDARLRVRGVRGLRVADASVMPCLPSGNTNAPTIMIGEHAAALIRNDSR